MKSPVAIKNGTTERIPPFAAMIVIAPGIVTNSDDKYGRTYSEECLVVGKPTDDSMAGVLFNGQTSIDGDGYGNGYFDEIVTAAYDAQDGSPDVGEEYGTAAGTWYLKAGKTGYKAISDGFGSFATFQRLGGSGGGGGGGNTVTESFLGRVITPGLTASTGCVACLTMDTGGAISNGTGNLTYSRNPGLATMPPGSAGFNVGQLVSLLKVGSSNVPIPVGPCDGFGNSGWLANLTGQALPGTGKVVKSYLQVFDNTSNLNANTGTVNVNQSVTLKAGNDGTFLGRTVGAYMALNLYPANMPIGQYTPYGALGTITFVSTSAGAFNTGNSSVVSFYNLGNLTHPASIAGAYEVAQNPYGTEQVMFSFNGGVGGGIVRADRFGIHNIGGPPVQDGVSGNIGLGARSYGGLVVDVGNGTPASTGDVADALAAAEDYADIAADDALTMAEDYADDVGNTAVATAGNYTDGQVSNATTSLQDFANTAASDAGNAAVTSANAFTTAGLGNLTLDLQDYADIAADDALTAAEAFAGNAANTAETNAVTTANAFTTAGLGSVTANLTNYTDSKFNDAANHTNSCVTNLANATTLNISNSANATLGAANNYTNATVANIPGVATGRSNVPKGTVPIGNNANQMGLACGTVDGWVLTARGTGNDPVFAPAPFDTAMMGLRLTLGNNPVETADIVACNTIRLLPFKGNQASVVEGVTSSLKLISTNASTLTLSGLTSGKNYDVYIYNSNSTLAMELGPAWTDDGTRSTDIVYLDGGIYVKSGNTTRRYIGSFRATSANTTEDSKQKRLLYNLYNQVPRDISFSETGTWTLNSATYRAMNNDATNRVEVVCGMAGAGYLSINGHIIARADVAGGSALIGVGINSTTVNSADILGRHQSSDTAYFYQIHSSYAHTLSLGYTTYTALETAPSGNVTFSANGSFGTWGGFTGWTSN